ncbi:MAG TPA: hypothetical protein DIT83_01230 [Barnesiella intestinihominis]|nr:hypothetical protein [Barnesiella intestinihominis]
MRCKTPRNATGHGREEGKRVVLNGLLGVPLYFVGVPLYSPLQKRNLSKVILPLYEFAILVIQQEMTKEKFQQTFISHAPENIW